MKVSQENSQNLLELENENKNQDKLESFEKNIENLSHTLINLKSKCSNDDYVLITNDNLHFDHNLENVNLQKGFSSISKICNYLKEDLKVSIDDVKIHTNINEYYQEIIKEITLNNNDSSHIDLNLKIPLDNEEIFTKFEAIKGKEIINSKIIEKEKGEEKFSDDLAEGNIPIIIKQDIQNNSLDLIFGNLPEKEKFKIKIYSLKMNKPEDSSLNSHLNPIFYLQYVELIFHQL